MLFFQDLLIQCFFNFLYNHIVSINGDCKDSMKLLKVAGDSAEYRISLPAGRQGSTIFEVEKNKNNRKDARKVNFATSHFRYFATGFSTLPPRSRSRAVLW